MTATYKTIIIDKPITTVSYSDDYGYYVSPTDVRDLLKKYADSTNSQYDHVFVAYKLGEDLHKEQIRTGDWIGLGGMVYKNDIGFSNIRITNENADLLYEYSSSNTFPEEVFIHEFLHNLERIENEYKYQIPELHDFEKYGYFESRTEGLKKWYTDYMKSEISDEKLGLMKEIYTVKPIHNSCFKNPINLTEEQFNEPENLIENIKVLMKKIQNFLKK